MEINQFLAKYKSSIYAGLISAGIASLLTNQLSTILLLFIIGYIAGFSLPYLQDKYHIPNSVLYILVGISLFIFLTNYKLPQLFSSFDVPLLGSLPWGSGKLLSSGTLIGLLSGLTIILTKINPILAAVVLIIGLIIIGIPLISLSFSIASNFKLILLVIGGISIFGIIKKVI